MEHDEGTEDPTAGTHGRVSNTKEEGHDIREATTLQGGFSGSDNSDAAAVGDGKGERIKYQQVNAVEEEEGNRRR